MRAADAAAAATGIGVDSLMEAAGAQVAERLLELFPATQQVLVLCGKGNNGGDGYVAARRLHERGLIVEVWELSATPSTDVAARARAAYLGSGEAPVPVTVPGLGSR